MAPLFTGEAEAISKRSDTKVQWTPFTECRILLV